MKSTPKFLKVLGLVALLAGAATGANAQNLITNPGFESGFTGWTVNDPSGFSGIGTNPAFANSGNQYAFLGASPNTGTLSQTIATTVGSVYTFSFFLANNMAAPINMFAATFGGVSVFSTTSPPFPATGAYSLVSTTVTALTSSTVVQFQYRNDPDFWRLDDVSVTAGAAVPEGGSTIWLALPAFAALGLLHLRLTRRAGLTRQ